MEGMLLYKREIDVAEVRMIAVERTIGYIYGKA
jgi:hypothetical protein